MMDEFGKYTPEEAYTNDEYNSISEEEAKEFMEKLGQRDETRRESFKDIGFMKFLMGMAIVDLASARIWQEFDPDIDYKLDEKQDNIKFWGNLVKKVPLDKAIRRAKGNGICYLDRTGNIGMVTRDLRNRANNEQDLTEEENKDIAAMGQRSTIEEGMAFAIARLENKMSRGKPLTEKQQDLLNKIKVMTQEEFDLIPQELKTTE